MTIILTQPLAANSAADEHDVRQIKKALNRLGYYTPYDKVGITGIPDAALFTALKKFQGDKGLSPTGHIRPDDDTVKALNRETVRIPDGFYIWRTVEDERVRKGHAQFNRTVRAWDDSPEPGEDYNCRCWAELVKNSIYPDAIYSTIGPFDMMASGLIMKGGLRIGLPVLTILRDILRRSPKLNEQQADNLARFIKKIPSYAKRNVEVRQLSGGNVKFSAVSSGKVFGSKAIYEKTISPQGKTVRYTKTTYDQYGNIVHVKNKIGGGQQYEGK